MSVMNEFKFASELLKRSQELSKAEASTITPKAGTSVLFNKFFCKAGSEEIKRLQSEAETKISANKERYSEKVAGELNLPIITELNESIQAIKNTVRSRVNENIDARVQRINETRSIPVRDSRMKMFQTIKMLLDLNADISGASHADVDCNGTIKCKVSGASKLIYSGNASVEDIDSSGASVVRKK